MGRHFESAVTGRHTRDKMTSKKSVKKGGEEYVEKRNKNNDAVKKSREKARKHMKETEKRVEILKQDNNKMEERIKLLSKELVFLKNLFLAHESSAHGPQLDDVKFMLEEDVEGEQETKISIL